MDTLENYQLCVELNRINNNNNSSMSHSTYNSIVIKGFARFYVAQYNLAKYR